MLINIYRKINDKYQYTYCECDECGTVLLLKNLKRHKFRKHRIVFKYPTKQLATVQDDTSTFMTDLSTVANYSFFNIQRKRIVADIQQKQAANKIGAQKEQCKELGYSKGFKHLSACRDTKVRKVPLSVKTFDIKSMIRPFEEAQLFFQGDRLFTNYYGFYNPTLLGIAKYRYYELTLKVNHKHYLNLAYLMRCFTEMYLLIKQRKFETKEYIKDIDVRKTFNELNQHIFNKYYLKRLRKYMLNYLHAAVDQSNNLTIHVILEHFKKVEKTPINIWDVLDIEPISQINLPGSIKWIPGKFWYLSQRYGQIEFATEFYYKSFNQVLLLCREALSLQDIFMKRFQTYKYSSLSPKMNLTLALLNQFQIDLYALKNPLCFKRKIKLDKAKEIIKLSEFYFRFLNKELFISSIVYQGTLSELEQYVSYEKENYNQISEADRLLISGVASTQDEQLKLGALKLLNMPILTTDRCKSKEIYLVVEPEVYLHQGFDVFWYYDCICEVHKRVKIRDRLFKEIHQCNRTF